MIIKFQSALEHDTWHIVENVEHVSYSENGVFTSPGEFMDSSKNDDECYSVWHSRMNVMEKDTFNRLMYRKDGVLVYMLFDGKAYVCNDEGKTIHQFYSRYPSGPSHTIKGEGR